MTKQIATKSEFQILLKSLYDAHEKEVRALNKEVSKLEKEVSKLKSHESFSSPLMHNIEEVWAKGRMAREKMNNFVATGKGRPSWKDWEALIRMCEVEHHDFIFYLLSNSKGLLSGRDFFVSLLVRDGWREYNIQILMNLSSERISNIFRKINSVLFDMDTSKNFEKNILAVRPDKRIFNFPAWIPEGT